MVSFFGKSGSREKSKPTPTTSSPSQMNREERQAFRREMLYQAIREGMISLEVNASMYKFKIMNLDSRHHRFVVMIDVTKSFKPRLYNKALDFHAIEDFIKKHTFDRFGLSLEGVYWRVSDTESPFERRTREGDSPATAAAALDSVRQQEEAQDTGGSGQRLARYPDQDISEEEKKAFVDAIRRRVDPPLGRAAKPEFPAGGMPMDAPKKRR